MIRFPRPRSGAIPNSNRFLAVSPLESVVCTAAELPDQLVVALDMVHTLRAIHETRIGKPEKPGWLEKRWFQK